jgi:hypothetical protein
VSASPLARATRRSDKPRAVCFGFQKAKRDNAALQRPDDNCARGKLSMRDMLIPVRCKRLLSCLFNRSLKLQFFNFKDQRQL